MVEVSGVEPESLARVNHNSTCLDFFAIKACW